MTTVGISTKLLFFCVYMNVPLKNDNFNVVLRLPTVVLKTYPVTYGFHSLVLELSNKEHIQTFTAFAHQQPSKAFHSHQHILGINIAIFILSASSCSQIVFVSLLYTDVT